MKQNALRHKRLHATILRRAEKSALQWLVSKLPTWVTPDLMTGLGLGAACLIFSSYWLTNINETFLWLANFGLILNWFGDSLDGTLARYRKIERPKFGYFIDHTVDALTQSLVALGIGLSPYVNIKFALIALVGYLLVSIHTYITIYVNNTFKLSFGRIGPTEIRVLLIVVNTIVYFTGVPAFTIPVVMISIYECIFLLGGFALFLTFIVSTIKQGIQIHTTIKKV